MFARHLKTILRSLRCRNLYRTFFFLAAVLFSACRTAPQVTTTLRGTDMIDKYGGLHFAMTSGEFLSSGFALSDVVDLHIAGQSVAVPVVANYRHVQPGELALVAVADTNRPLFATVFYGDAAAKLAIARKTDSDGTREPVAGVVFPLDVVIRLAERGGFIPPVSAAELKRTNNRADYPKLSDEDFANFREVSAPHIARGRLFRSSSPVNPALGRNTFADAAAQKAGVKTVVNMVDAEAEAKAFPGWSDAYAARCETLFRPMGVNVGDADFAAGIRDCCRFMARHEPPYLIHCKEGKDRTGFACAVLELLQGADRDDMIRDYLATFRNYYGLADDSAQMKRLASDITKNLQMAFGLESLPNSATDLADAVRAYLLKTGLTPDEIKALQEKLSTSQR